MRILLCLILVLLLLLVSGCTGDTSLLEISRSSITVQNFLSDYPDAEVTTAFLISDYIREDSDFINNCMDLEIKPYYKVVYTSDDGARVVAFIRKSTGVECVFSEDFRICTEEWTCNDWGGCLGGFQTRLCIDQNVCGTGFDRPPEIKRCPADCYEEWICTEWMPLMCPENRTLTRNCTDVNACGTDYYKPLEIAGCEYECFEDWDCGAWSLCENGTQERNCFDFNQCGTTIYKPATEQVCYENCIDSDNGDDYLTKGLTSNGSVFVNDYCDGVNLIEYRCSVSNRVASRAVFCPDEFSHIYQCKNGVCVPNPDIECYDDRDCGGLNTTYFCEYGNILHQNTTESICVYPATPYSYCKDVQSTEVVEVCQNGCENHTCVTEREVRCLTDEDCDYEETQYYCKEINGDEYVYFITNGLKCVYPGTHLSNCEEYEARGVADYCPFGCDKGRCFFS